MSTRFRGFAGMFYLGLSIVLGGASAAGALANGILQVVAIIAILALVWTRRATLPAEARPLVWLVGIFLAFCAVTLIPLPSSIWSALPGRGYVSEGFYLLGIERVRLPISLAAGSTLSSLIWMLPPTAMFLLVSGLPPEHRQRLSAGLIVFAVLSIALGIFQLMGGPTSGMRFYSVTNAGAPVGFFANINHQVTLLLIALPCAAVIAARFASGGDRSTRSGGLILGVAVAIFLAAGIAAAGSVAGYGLFIPAAFASILIYRRALAGSIGYRWKIGLAGLSLVFLGLAFLGPLNEQALSQKFEKPLNRGVIAMTTVGAIAQTMPVGTGLGTFSAIYRRLEDPNSASKEYVNHAHNDYLEIALELGVVGILLMLLFVIWWVRRSLAVWRSDFRGANLARAGSVIIGIILLHSLVDYPIRTSAIAVVFAMSCAFLVPYSGSSRRGKSSAKPGEGENLRHLEAV